MSADELVKEFLIESFENLSLINDQLTKLENNGTDKELVNAIYRTIHTMKGSAGFLGFQKLNDLTHNTENLLDMVREDKLPVTSSLIDVFFGVFDICQEMLKSIEDNGNEGSRDVSKLNEKLVAFMSKAHGVQEESSPQSVQDEEEDELDSLIESHASEAGVTSIEDDSISAAALDSLREQVEAGVLDASVLDEFMAEQKSEEVDTANDKAESSKVEEPKVETQSNADEISSAALDSLREQVEAGVIDASVLEEFEKEMGAASTDDNVVPIKEPQTIVESEPVATKEESVTEATPVESQVAPDSEAISNKKSVADSIVRVNVQALDKIMNIVGELVLNRNQIVQHSNMLNNSELNRLSQQLNVITSELQGEVMSTRMQPVGNILNMFERLIRDLSKEFSKKIQLKLAGQETELDKTLIEAIKDPLVHIVRNACDHGLEYTQEREAAGKNAIGLIEIKAYNESGQVIIEINDDGKGLSREKILNKAIEKGLVQPDKASSLNDQQIFHLIFNPGFSTADKVTNISGRGVGMDVVKINIEKIGGSVNVSSREGEGTTFKLKIPLTLAIVPALIIRSIGEFFAIPQLNLVELVRLEENEFSRIQNIKGTEFLKLRGKLTPVFRLNDLLDLNDVHQKSNDLLSVVEDDGVTSALKSSDEKESKVVDTGLNIVILSAYNRVFGIVVDEIMDTEEIVVKPLNNQLNNIGVFGGATIMGDGRVALIVDAPGFLSHFTGVKDKKLQEVEQSSETKVDYTEIQENLLFRLEDDRIYAIPLGLVSRLEEFQTKKLEKTGNQPIMRYLDAPMPLIDVEKTLKLTAKSVLETKEKEQLPCIVTNVRRQSFGIVVKEILDINIDKNKIDSSAVDRDGIMGTIFVGDQTVSMIDLYNIVNAQSLGVSNKIQKTVKKNKTILLVDDSVMYRKLEGDALIDEGYDVILANNGNEALVKLANYADKIDLIITDIEMPELDGFGFAAKVRESKQYDNLQIVALSTRVSENDKKKGKECGFNFHLEKFKRDEIVELVNNIIAK